MTTHTDDSLGSIPVLPCPFCGSSGLLETCPAESTQRELFWVECEGDNCGISGRIRYTANDAINAWNRRPAPAAAVRMLTDDEIGYCECNTLEATAREVQREFCKVNGLTLGAAAEIARQASDRGGERDA
jgi:Lar family restriction alleviation protein